jgi:hypothetical protein
MVQKRWRWEIYDLHLSPSPQMRGTEGHPLGVDEVGDSDDEEC